MARPKEGRAFVEQAPSNPYQDDLFEQAEQPAPPTRRSRQARRRSPRARALACIEWAESHIVNPYGLKKGPLQLRPWQRKIILAMFVPGVRIFFILMARKNGKSFLTSVVALWVLCNPEVESALILSIGPTERQALTTLKQGKALVRKSPKLRAMLDVRYDHIENRQTGSRWEAMTISPAGTSGQSGEDRLQSLEITLAILDEVHLWPDRKVVDACLNSMATAVDPLMVLTTTPDDTDAGVAYELSRQAKAGIPGFSGVEFVAPEGCSIHDRRAWRAANPGLGDFLPVAQVELEVKVNPEHKFRRFRLAQWSSPPETYLPVGAWSRLGDQLARLELGSNIWLAFDGSLARDSTALVACNQDNLIVPLGLWEKPDEAPKGWRVPRQAVKDRIAEVFDQYKVVRFLVDPPYWQDELLEWQEKWGEDVVLEYPTYSKIRMAPASQRFYSAVVTGKVSHTQDPDLARHLANCVTASSPHGDYITKVSKDSPKHIDLAVCAVLAYEAHQTAPLRPSGAFFIP